MSVPAGERKENRLEVFNLARDLAVYTIQITKNEKIFLPEYKGAVTDDLIDTAKNIYIDAWEANNVLVNMTPKNEVERMKAMYDWMDRRKLQQKAARECNRLLSLIGIAKSTFHLKGKRVKYWTGKVLIVRGKIRSWTESDNKRYSDAIGKPLL